MSPRGILASFFLYSATVLSATAGASPVANEVVYVETTLDTDGDGQLDRIYVDVTRPRDKVDVPAIFTISPYAMGGNDVAFHNVDVSLLPQDIQDTSSIQKAKKRAYYLRNKGLPEITSGALARGYASVSAHSLGTGRSTGCPTVGDRAETLAAKAVIDWLNGRAKAYSQSGREVTADWANGSVGMTGVSYNGTLPNMVATTGVEGLKAIIPVAAISSWYDYYRANGLVVGPGGYIGEDADILGKFIVKRGTCSEEIQHITASMGREHGDFTEFWQERDYVAQAANVRAAVFIMHGQSDWNVRQRHAIQWWNALEGVAPRRMWLHRGGHSHPGRADLEEQTWAWFDRYVKGVENGVESEPAVEVESPDGTWTVQDAWPNENTENKRFYLNSGHNLAETAQADATALFVDKGKQLRLSDLITDPTNDHESRLAFVTDPLSAPLLISGTTKVHLSLAVTNRKAANITVAIVEYNGSGRARVVTRGWADPQNHDDMRRGELLIPGEEYQLTFDIEPKQYTFAARSRIGVVVTSTDYEHTIRPDAGTQVEVALGQKSFVEMQLSVE